MVVLQSYAQVINHLFQYKYSTTEGLAVIHVSTIQSIHMHRLQLNLLNGVWASRNNNNQEQKNLEQPSPRLLQEKT